MRKTLLSLMIAVILGACQKEAPMVQQDALAAKQLSSERHQIVSECKEWYESKMASSGKLASSGQVKGSAPNSFVGNPNWNKPGFISSQQKSPEFNRFPLNDYEVNYSFTERMNPKGYRDIMLRKYGEGNFVVDIMEGHPDADYLDRKRKEKGLDETS